MKQYIIDVREPYEYAEGHVDGAINISPTLIMQGSSELNAIPKDAPIILYCRTGSRSNTAIHILRSLGYTNLTNGINKGHVEAKYL